MLPHRLKISLVASFILLAFTVKAQNFDGPVAYMAAITSAQEDMNKKYMAYLSASAHGKRLKKVEKLRQQALESINQSESKVLELPAFNGDQSLKQSAIKHIKFCYKIFNDDYANIVNMEEIAEQSFDEMQAYLLLKEKTKEKLKEANNAYEAAYNAFAKKNNVQIIESKSELSEKMEKVGALNQYHDKIYLLFFKCNWQDAKLVEAISNKKVTEIEQRRNALAQYANEGIAALAAIKPFDGDASLIGACKQALLFYKKTAENDVLKLTDFYLKEENFEKMKKAFEAKSESDRTNQDIDAFNKGVKEINAAVNAFNQTTGVLNSARVGVVDAWNATEKSFIDTHMPYFKK
ncbi:MAG: hypothetical protein EAY68_02905 [Bacteroidetes bacterium]|nr:MAG: hypothetical protein EAY68_02905 [Bacteroidota bacterium]